jgi:hypothetical protein
MYNMPQNLQIYYKFVIRHVIEYGSLVCGKLNACNFKVLESIQSPALWFISNVGLQMIVCPFLLILIRVKTSSRLKLMHKVINKEIPVHLMELWPQHIWIGIRVISEIIISNNWIMPQSNSENTNILFSALQLMNGIVFRQTSWWTLL